MDELTKRVKRPFDRDSTQKTDDETVSAHLVPKSLLEKDQHKKHGFDKLALNVAGRIVDVYGSFFDAQKIEEEREEGSYIDYVFTNGQTSIKYLVRSSKERLECCGLVIEEPKLRVTYASLFLSSILDDHLITYRDDCENRLGLFCLHSEGSMQGDAVLALLGISIVEVVRYFPTGQCKKEPY
ncbi:hypothetical protein J4219_09130 [Candidatus Woesearchaeota archaeon]|nr:hypothetical protein [Candidatus Woesearchaeota archaeon]